MKRVGNALVIALFAAGLTAPMSAAFGAGAPPIPGADEAGTEPKGSGTRTSYTSSKSPEEIMRSYEDTLKGDGWQIHSAGGGGSSWGGGADLSATKGGEYLVMSAGGTPGMTNIDLCVWPERPEDDDC
ncbi:hypothetical protein [Roseibium sp. RKSG952]|uniref:hypothetical protein n=1 Tax=Roseibium sp. RKSG952 TaxID=2529384 RepID=UPI0012BD3DF1|nr:hypothetical protein [Roseibium sp. RKSG952]MTH97279.1 hypothetical protein [Roseibium sp. RKSG952]